MTMLSSFVLSVWTGREPNAEAAESNFDVSRRWVLLVVLSTWLTGEDLLLPMFLC
jgi:hypothetical protein